MTTLTAASQSLFISLASDAGNWGGQPLIDISTSQRGNLTDLKKNGLLKTFRSEGCDFANFTDAGKELAKANGIKI